MEKTRNGMSWKDAAYLGGEKSKQKRIKRIEKYNLDPFLCKNCNKPIPYEKRVNEFCNRSCATTFLNMGVSRNEKSGKWKKKPCQFCGEKTENKKFCSRKCEHNYNLQNRRRVLKELGKINTKTDKWYLIELRSHKCEICDHSKWNAQDIPLDIHHIDGNSDNNKFNNLLLICPNCHRQTTNHGSKNKTNSKKKAYRKKRYDQGLSY